MVCKKSLYCLKNGPCASYQVRKQIWEDNIRFRESLKSINQSDHYWSFQLTNNEYFDFDEPSCNKGKNKDSLKSKNCNDCASITHKMSSENNDFNLTCLCNHDIQKSGQHLKMTNTTDLETEALNTKSPLTQPYKTASTNIKTIKRESTNNSNVQCNRNSSSYSSRLKNSVTSQLQPSMKVKFSSQSTLGPLKREIKKYPSMEIISKFKNFPTEAVKNFGSNSRCEFKDQPDAVIKRKNASNNYNIDNNNKESNKVKLKYNKSENKEIKLAPWLSGTPLTKTTRKMLNQDKKIPFATFGCNNVNDVVGSKKTHNVFASKKEVFPNALAAKMQREDLLSRSLKKEKKFQNSTINDKKLINHSSLWANDINFSDHNKDKSTKRKNTSCCNKFH